MFFVHHCKVTPGGIRRLPILASLVGLAAILGAASLAHAQQYDSLEPKIGRKAEKKLRTVISKAMKDPAEFEANKQQVDDYFLKYYFPRMTTLDPESLGRLAKVRETLFKQYIRGARFESARQHITDLTLRAMSAIARRNYHPAVRYNAVLVLGMLDQKLAGAGTAPEPLPAATKDLLELLTQDEIKGLKVPASVKVGALVGLERHARFGADEQYVEPIATATLALMAQNTAPDGIATGVHNWMRCQAAGILARLYAGGPTAEVQTAWTALIADPNMNLEDRCSVASLIGGIEYEDAAEVDSAATLLALGDLMKSVISEEAKLAHQYQKDLLARRRDVKPVYERRQLLARLKSITDAANSLKATLPDESRQNIDSLIDSLGTVVSVAQDRDSVDLDVAGEVIDVEETVATVVDNWKKPAEAPVEGTETVEAEEVSS